jgi:hypothetical protein
MQYIVIESLAATAICQLALSNNVNKPIATPKSQIISFHLICHFQCIMVGPSEMGFLKAGRGVKEEDKIYFLN